MKLGLEELSIIVEGLRSRVKQLAGTAGTLAGSIAALGSSLTALSTATKIEAGDFGFTFYGAGIMTDGKKHVIVTIPLNMSVGSLTPQSVNITDILIVQAGNTVFQASDGIDTLDVVPSAAANPLHCGLRIDLYKKNSLGTHIVINSNAIDNDCCGVHVRGTITFS